MLDEVVFFYKKGVLDLNQQKDIEREIKKYLKLFFSDEFSKWELNKFSPELIKYPTNVKGFKNIKKTTKSDIKRNDYLYSDKKTELIINKIKKKVKFLFELIYVEIFKELILSGKEKTGLLKFEFHNNKLKNEKQFYWEFFLFLMKKLKGNMLSNEIKLFNALQSTDLAKYRENPFSHYDLTHFKKNEAWILMFNSKLEFELDNFLLWLKDNSKNLYDLLNCFTNINDYYLGSKFGENNEYDFSKIDFLLFYKNSLQIKRWPFELAIESERGDINIEIEVNWWIKLIPETILVFSLAN